MRPRTIFLPSGFGVGSGRLVFFIVTATLAMDFYKVEELKVGMPSPADYRAPRTVDYIDEEKTEELRETAARLVEPVYDPDLVVNNEVLAELGQSFLTIRKIRSRTDLEENEKREQLRGITLHYVRYRPGSLLTSMNEAGLLEETALELITSALQG